MSFPSAYTNGLSLEMAMADATLAVVVIPNGALLGPFWPAIVSDLTAI